jgi:hypothetical protein
MARRSLSNQGRIVAAGVSVAVGSALVGFMYADDHSAATSQTNPSSVSATGASGSGTATATPADGRTGNDSSSNDNSGNDGFGGVPSGSTGAQPQTRTGGS